MRRTASPAKSGLLFLSEVLNAGAPTLRASGKSAGKSRTKSSPKPSASSGSEGERTFSLHVRLEKLPPPVAEHRFDPARRWRFDFAWPDLMLAVEVEGGTWRGGRHTRGSGFAKDCEKYNRAAALGWSVLRFTTDMVKRGDAIATTKEIILARCAQSTKPAKT